MLYKISNLSNDTIDLPQAHEHALKLVAGGTEMLDVDHDLGDLRKVRHVL